MGTHRLVLIAAASALTGVAQAASADECKLDRAATIPVHLTPDDRLIADVSVDGRKASFAVALDLDYSALTPVGAQVFGVQLLEQRSQSLFYRGSKITSQAHLDTMTVGNVAEDGRFIAVLPDQPSGLGGDLDGVLGDDFLRRYDVEIDPAGTMNLFAPNSCGRSPVYWAKEWFEAPLEIDGHRQATLTVSVDGKPIKAILDTSIGRSAFAASGSGGHQIGALVFGGITFHNVAVDPLEAGPPGELRLGMHELKHFRFYLDYANSKLYFTLAGVPKSTPS
jgi:hypothetical protein